jgi:homoserine dehydrogenase
MVAGIINGTGNFILTEMRDQGRDFADVLKEAQECHPLTRAQYQLSHY